MRIRGGRAALTAALLGAAVVPVLSAQPALGALAKEVNVKAESSFKIDPDRGFNQYYGDLDYTKVVAENPKNGKVPDAMAKGARSTCLKWFVEADQNGRYSGFKIYHDEGTTGLWTDNWRVVKDGGRWVSRGFNADPGEEVVARGVFWDADFNFQRKFESTTFSFKGKRIHANCDGELDLKRDYPG